VGFEKSHLFGKIELDISTTVEGTFSLSTDVPGRAMVQRYSFTVPVTTRRTVRARLPGPMVGHLCSAIYTPGQGGTSELYGVRVWVRELPAGQWYWFPLPVVETPALHQQMQIPVEPTGQSFTQMQIPVEPTGESFTQMQIPVEPTGQSFTQMQIPVEPTGQSFTQMQIPVEPTGQSFTQMQIPVPPTPADFSNMALPVEPTPESFSQLSLPVKPTPPVPEWVSVAVDD
jgi:hypothetical protein